jgi:mRNA interferase HigB
MARATFENPHELRQAFPTVDFVGESRAVFNIGGNKYRLIVDMRYTIRRVYVVGVMTHAEYDRTDVPNL